MSLNKCDIHKPTLSDVWHLNYIHSDDCRCYLTLCECPRAIDFPQQWIWCMNPLAKCILVTGSPWACLRVVEPESQSGQSPEFTGLMQWPAGAPGNTWEHWRPFWEHRPHAWKHLGALAKSLRASTTSLGVPTTSLGAHWITIEQSVKNIFLGNTAVAPGNHSYYLSFNDC